MNLNIIYESFKMELECIERDLILSLQTDQETLYNASSHPLKAGGKRLRPLFVLIAGQFGEYDMDNLKKLAISMELIHMATLVHDDVIDNSFMRRGHKTVRALWGDQVAMISGDFIFSRALECITELKNPYIHQVFSRTLLQMCRGEMLQFKYLFNKDQSLRNYMHRIKRKTAILFAISCQLGASISRAEQRVVEYMCAYGYYIGMAFQLIDDVLDFVGDASIIGKPVGGDLLQGNVTLPVIYALHHASTEEKQQIELFLDSNGKRGILEDSISIVRQIGGIKFTQELAEQYIHKAIYVTKKLPECTARQTLQLVAKFLANRAY